MFEKVKAFVSAHPWETAGIVFVIGAILLYLFWPRSGSATSQTQDLSPYYNAQAAAQAAGTSVYNTEIAANAATAQHAADVDAAVKIAGIQAGTAATNSDNQLAAITANISAELDALKNNNSTTVSLANIDSSNKTNANATALQIVNANDSLAYNIGVIGEQTSNFAATTAAQTAQTSAMYAAQVAEVHDQLAAQTQQNADLEKAQVATLAVSTSGQLINPWVTSPAH